MRRIASQHSIPKSCNTACHYNPKIPLQLHMNFGGFRSSPRHYFSNFRNNIRQSCNIWQFCNPHTIGVDCKE